jgi:flagellum-specific ATP synthase
MSSVLAVDEILSEVRSLDSFRSTGTVSSVIGLLIRSRGPLAAVGDLLQIQIEPGNTTIAQVIGFRDGEVLSMALEETQGLRPGLSITARSGNSRIGVGPGLLGRVLDGFGHPMDGLPPPRVEQFYSLHASPPNPLERRRITEPLVTGVRAIDGLLTSGKGQRVGIFGGSGVGKSTLLGAMSRKN